MSSSSTAKLQNALLQWYAKNKRDLPWRKNRDPYRIWISEVMLQQTTVTAVIPFFERFMKALPSLKTLANASESQVLELWAGLGYYSRARNLHKAAQQLSGRPFPKTHEELIQYPGFGPYTSRSITSIAFDHNAGVLDGNVIRVLSRLDNQSIEWWKTTERKQLQDRADQLVQGVSSSEMNQALMELGATICKPTSPACLLCPWQKSCNSLKADTYLNLPLAKPKRQKEIWIWEPLLLQKEKKVALVKNDYAPFLKGQWLYPGKASLKKKAPKKFSFKHNITHHEIYVLLNNLSISTTPTELSWVHKNQLPHWNPSALLKKALERTLD